MKSVDNATIKSDVTRAFILKLRGVEAIGSGGGLTGIYVSSTKQR